jgi:hypothetical protein
MGYRYRDNLSLERQKERQKKYRLFDMEDFENLLALILVSLFLGGFLIVGFYTQLRETSRVPASSAADSEETVESPTA